MHLLTVLPTALVLALWAAAETGVAKRVSCPAYCAARVIYVRNHTVSTERGVQAEIVAEITYKLQVTKPNVEKVKIKIGATWVLVPKPLKVLIETQVKKYPEIRDVLIEILVSKVERPRFTTTRRPAKTTKKTKPPARKTTTRKARTQPTRKNKPKLTTKRTSRPKTTPKLEQYTVPPPATPRIAPEDATKSWSIPPVPKDVNDTVRATLELLLNFPNHFATIHHILVELGVKFPDTRKPIYNVTIGAQVIPLPKPVTVDFTIKIKGKEFHLPKDTSKVAKYVSKHTAELTILVTVLHQLGSKFYLDKTGRMAGFEVMGQKENFPRALNAEVVIRAKKFSLPKDLNVLLTFVKDKPAEFFKLEMILRAFGVRFDKASGGGYLRATYRKKSFDISLVPNVRITVGVKQYDIPSDLDSMLKSPVGVHVGEILTALQRANVPVNVDKKTGVVLGIVINKVKIPFPVTLDLRFRLDGKVYIVPYDLPKIIVELEKRNMPSHIVSILYRRYGVVPVRNNDDDVTALSFNKEKFPIKQQAKTVVIIAGLKFFLPKDASKMVDALVNKKFNGTQMMRALQLAGYTFVPEADGVLRTIQKGANKIDLRVGLELFVRLNKQRYRIPNDLPRLVAVVRSLHLTQIKQIMTQLEKFGVIFARKGSKLIIMFNGMKYEVDLKFAGDGASTEAVIININNIKFSIPKDIKGAVSYANRNGPGAMKILIELLKAHSVKVNLSPSGNIISIVFEGKLYTVGTVDDSIQVKIRGKQFWIPRDLLSLPKKFKNFNFAEVVIALMKKGAKLQVDGESNFYGFLFKGREVRFPRKFRIMVRVDTTGKEYRVPGQLGDLAKTLSKGKWSWTSVRAQLRAAGIKVAGKSGPVRSFSFQGKNFNVR